MEQYEDFFAALEKASPVPIAFEQITNGANGYFSLTDKRIAIKEGVSELQAVKTAIHEIAHAKLHDVDLNAPPEQQNRVDRHTCEVEAESVAYTVCQHFGLDTSDYSFGYVAGWSSGKEMTELKEPVRAISSSATLSRRMIGSSKTPSPSNWLRKNMGSFRNVALVIITNLSEYEHLF